MANVVKQAVDTFGGIQVLINNAQASASGVPLAEHTTEQFDLAIYSGLYAAFYYMKACYPYLAESHGSVINFASGAGLFGNCNVVIDETADLRMAVESIIHSKTFDNGMICASEQSVVVLDSIYDRVKAEFIKRGCYVLNGEEIDKVRAAILINGPLAV